MTANEDFKTFIADQIQFGPASLLSVLVDKRFSASNSSVGGQNFLGLSRKCLNDLMRISSGALRNEPWALSVFDSNGKSQSGLMSGSLFNFIGKYDQCLESNSEPEAKLLGGLKYCLAQFDLSPEATALASLTGLPEVMFRPNVTSRVAKFGFCVPVSCKPMELVSLANHISNGLKQIPFPRLETIQCSENETVEPLENFYVSIIFIVMMLLVVGSCLWAAIVDQSPNRSSSSSSNDTKTTMAKEIIRRFDSSDIMQEERSPGTMNDNNNSDDKGGYRDSLFNWWVETFSLIRAYKRMVTKRNRFINLIDLSALDGLRVISMFWTIAMHSYNFGFQWLLYDNLKQVGNVYKTPWIQWIANGTFSVDNFFLISGILTWFKLYSYQYNRSRIRQLTAQISSSATTTTAATITTNNNSNLCHEIENENKSSQLVFNTRYCFITIGLRYLRLMPTMMLLILFSTTILPNLAYGFNWSNSTIMFDLWCRTNWPLNLFMLQNLISTKDMCFSHSWYIAVDFQLFILLQFILVLFVCRKNKQTIHNVNLNSNENRSSSPVYMIMRKWILFILILMAQILVATIVYYKQLPSIPLIPADSLNNSILDYYGLVYIKPYYWLTSYFLGALLGSCLASASKNSMKRSRMVKKWPLKLAKILQVIPLITMTLLILSTWPYFSDIIHLTQLQSTLLALFTRPLWSLSMASLLYFTCLRSRFNLSNRLMVTRIISKLLRTNLWLIPSRLTYSAFLLHPVIMAIFYGSRIETFQFSHSLLLYFTLGHLVLTYLGALFIYLFIESPIYVLIEQLKKQLFIYLKQQQQQHCSCCLRRMKKVYPISNQASGTYQPGGFNSGNSAHMKRPVSSRPSSTEYGISLKRYS